MKAAVLYAPGDIRIEDVDKPEISDNEVLVHVHYCGLCGSDVNYYKGKVKLDSPMINGHEISGEVVAVGAGVTEVENGERVVVQPNFNCGQCYLCKRGKFNICKQRITVGKHVPGGFAEFVKIPQEYACRIPNGISYEAAALTEPYTVGLHAFDRAKLKVGDKTVVIGAGPIGLCFLQMAKIGGAQVCVIDLVKHRLDFAQQLGADVIIDASKVDPVKAVMSWSKVGVDVAVEAVGMPQTAEEAIEMVHPGGRVVFLGILETPIKVTPWYILKNEIEITGSVICLNDDFPRVLDLFRRGQIKGETLITHRVELEGIDKAFRLMAEGKSIKIVIQCRK